MQIASSGTGAYGLRVNTGGDANTLAVMGDGRVGVATASPTAKLNVGGADPRLVLGASTPDSWFTDSYDMGVIQIGATTFHARDTKTNGTWGGITTNAYLDSTGNWAYMFADEASQYQQADGTHSFRVTESGAADDPITWITALQITSDGAFSISGDTGTSGQVLTSGGASAVPTWEDSSGGSSGVTALSETATVTIDFSSTKLQTLTVTGTCDTLATSNRSAGKEVVLRIYNNAGDYGYFAPTTPNSSADWKEIDQSISSTGVLDGAYGILKLTSWGTADTDVTAELLISP